MWLVNIAVAGLAVTASLLNLHHSNMVNKFEQYIENQQNQKFNVESEILQLKIAIENQKLKSNKDTTKLVVK